MSDLICIDASHGRVSGNGGLCYLGRYTLTEMFVGGPCEYCGRGVCSALELSEMRYRTWCERRFVRAAPPEISSSKLEPARKLDWATCWKPIP